MPVLTAIAGCCLDANHPVSDSCCMRKQVWTKAWSAALLNAIGDILAQLVVDKNEKLDYKRLGIFTILVCWSLTSVNNSPSALLDPPFSLLLVPLSTLMPLKEHISMCRV